MKFSCDQCHAQYMIADEKVGTRGVKVKCKKCGNIIVVKPSATDDAAAAAAASPAAAAGPSPAASAGASPAASGGFSAPAAAAAPAGDGQMGGAFDSLFGGGMGATASAPSSGGGLGSLAAASAAASPAPGKKPAGEKEWYVAIDDSQVGPIDISEIEQRWDGKEIDEDSLAWKAGMSDWMPLAEIPELAYLVTERPQKKAQPVRSASAGGAFAGASAGGASAGLGPVAFGAGNGAGGEEISWKPSAASALSSLVQEELTAAATPKAEAPTARPPDGMPSFGAGDLFGAGGGNGASGGAARPMSDPFGAPAPSWSVPATQRRESSFKPVYLLFGFLGVGILGLLGVLVWNQMKQGQGVGQLLAQNTQPGTQPQNAGSGGATTPAPQNTGGGGATTPAPQNTGGGNTATPHEDRTPHGGTTKRVETADHGTPNTKTNTGGGKENIDDVFKEEKKPPPGGGGPPLTPAEVKAFISENGRSVGPCIIGARKANEIVPGSYTFILDWTVKADGSVAGPRMKGPANVMGTSLPACFAGVMRKWHFRASPKDTPIANYPLGPVNIK